MIKTKKSKKAENLAKFLEPLQKIIRKERFTREDLREIIEKISK